MARHRTWCFTLNAYTEEELDVLMDEDNDDIQYICFGKEVAPTTGTPHLQGWVHFKQRVSMAICKGKLGGRRFHVESCKGNYEQNELYCRKTREEDDVPNDDVYCRGTLPMDRKAKGDSNKERWEVAWDCAKKGDLESIDADIRVKQYNVLNRIMNDEQARRTKHTLDDLEHEWYFGPSGTGKSRKAREENPDAYLKMCNKWWDGYNDEEVVLIEDFDSNHSVLCHHIKIWGDRYPFLMEIKGSARKSDQGR